MPRPTVRVRFYPKFGGTLRFSAINRRSEVVYETEQSAADVLKMLEVLPTGDRLIVAFRDRSRVVPIAAVRTALGEG